MLADGTQIRLNNDTVPSNVPPLEPSLVVTSRGNRGERNTLAYRFGEIMTIAENLFGQRNTSYLFLGFEFVPGHARVRYVTDKSLVIQLSFQAMHNPMEAYAELAHECIHLLSPHPRISVKILEEGMATVFSFMYMRDTMKAPILTTEQEHYDEAARLVAMLMQIDPYGIKKIREEEPDTRNITKELIQKYYPTIPEEVAARLARTFLTGLQEEDVPARSDWYNRESFDADLPLENSTQTGH